MLNILMSLVQDTTHAEPVAEAAAAAASSPMLGVGIGMGLAILGAGLGLGWIGSQTGASIARQPEAAAKIENTPRLIAFLMEGATIIALVLTFVASIMA